MKKQLNNLAIQRFLVKAMVLAAPLAVFVPAESRASDWTWQFAPYVWVSDVGLDVAINGDPQLGVDDPFTDLLDKVDMALMGHLEGRGETFGVFADALYLSLGDQSTTSVGPGGPISGEIATDADMKLGIYELGGSYQLSKAEDGGLGFELLLGVRFINMDQTIDLTLPGPLETRLSKDISMSETDLFGGGRLIGNINQDWSYRLRVDYGDGGTDGTFNAIGAIHYTFGERRQYSLDLGYRYMNMELSESSDGSTTESDVTVSGPFVGFAFNF